MANISPFAHCDFGFPSSDPHRECTMYQILGHISECRNILNQIEQDVINASPKCDIERLEILERGTSESTMSAYRCLSIAKDCDINTISNILYAKKGESK